MLGRYRRRCGKEKGGRLLLTGTVTVRVGAVRGATSGSTRYDVDAIRYDTMG